MVEGRARTRVLLVVLVLTVGVGAAALWSAYRMVVLDTPGDGFEHAIVIPRGARFADLAGELEAAGAIRSALVFRIYGRLTGDDERIKAGPYLIDGSMSGREILDAFVTGRTVDTSIPVTIPEGWRKAQIAQRMAARGVIDDAGSFVSAAHMREEYRAFPLLAGLETGQSLEGYLYPDTYRFEPESDPGSLVRTMLDTFHRRLEEGLSSRAAAELVRRSETPGGVHDLLTLASIVQAESPSGDMREIAGVFANRLEIGQRLESDATVNYALGTHALRPTFAQVLTDHPYNTYRFVGLPPGPIGNPGLEAVEASLDPAEHEFFFFLHKPTRETVLSRDYQEHLRNIARYLD